MGFLDKAKSAAESATSKAKEGIEDVQAKRELNQAHDALGKLTYELHQAGEISHERLNDLVNKIHKLKTENPD